MGPCVYLEGMGSDRESVGVVGKAGVGLAIVARMGGGATEDGDVRHPGNATGVGDWKKAALFSMRDT